MAGWSEGRKARDGVKVRGRNHLTLVSLAIESFQPADETPEETQAIVELEAALRSAIERKARDGIKVRSRRKIRIVFRALEAHQVDAGTLEAKAKRELVATFAKAIDEMKKRDAERLEQAWGGAV